MHIPQLIFDFGAVTTIAWMTPSHHGFICQNYSKSKFCAENLLHIPQLILDFGAVTNIAWMTPSHSAFIGQHGSKSMLCATDLLHIPQLTLDSWAVTTIVWMTPSHHGFIYQDCNKSRACATNLLHIPEPAGLKLQSCHHHSLDDPKSPHFHLPKWQRKHVLCHRSAAHLHIPQLILLCGAVTTIVWMTPSHHGFICQDCSKSRACATNLLHIPEPVWNFRAVTATVLITPGHHRNICQNWSKSICCATNLLHIPQLILDAWDVTTMVSMAPSDNSITSNTPQNKRRGCCSYLWLLCYSSKGAPIVQPRKAKRVFWIQKTPFRCNKSQEILSKRLLSSYFQVNKGARLRDWKGVAPSTW